MSDTAQAAPDWKLRAIIGMGTALLRALAATWRLRVHNPEVVADARANGRSIVLILWHGQMLVPLHVHRRQQIAILISEHRDGEIITGIARAFGQRAVRGSSSRGAARALLGLARELDSGYDVAVTPDGPRGPYRVFAPGALVAAQRTGAPVIPIGVAVSSAWTLRSWDRFIIPKPFARVSVVYGEAVVVRTERARDAAALTPEFQERMADAIARAEAQLGART